MEEQDIIEVEYKQQKSSLSLFDSMQACLDDIRKITNFDNNSNGEKYQMKL